MRKNERFTGTCTGYTNEGLGVVKHEGEVFFVPHLLKGETADIVCTLAKKNFAYGRVLNIIDKSKHRTEAKCSCYRQCGGCQLQYMDITEQQAFKTDKVRQCFRSIAHMEPDINDCLMGEPYRYRNKVQVPVQVDGTIRMGFYKNRSNEIVEFEDCLVQSELSNQIIQYLKKTLPVIEAMKLRHILIKHAHNSGQMMVVFITRQPLHFEDEYLNRFKEHYPMIRTIIENINDRNDNVILGEEEKVLLGDGIIEEQLLDCTFTISSKSFYQINPAQTAVLYSTALEKAQLNKDDILIDLYCGTGTIGILASKYVKEVIGIEIVAEAIIDAGHNAKANGRDNISFICADAGKGAEQLIERDIRPSVVIVDPPRKGLDKTAIEAIRTMNPDRVVYVSCDPSTLARDVALLKDNYEIKEVQPVDMFPMTSHVETVVLLTKG
ncbi:MAG: 23S rRNA (uracil(1939)-C(5))-methyltransferase RlmD [Erysipelotrichaceae bacterium]|nr:23S rRNA (uracil(1939)-C(5))-methyltransferase RlmD [Erysipelotrichaceae bacterium]